ncbi:MAG: cation:proton antiporter [Gemmatimonadetes bacterium]|nr:cation:proton antiporter [Gemmatimonadota bacterium]NIO32123.1 cation:proton antiporter [Gemmatimonadota bacterium]
MRQGGRLARRARRRRLLLWAVAGIFLVGISGYRAPTSEGLPASDPAAPVAQIVAGQAAAASESGGQESGAHTTARFLLIIVAILMVGKFSGELAERIGQPAVLGELLGGVILGGSVLGIVPTAPGDPMAEMVHLLAEIGVVILLFEVGLETDLKEMFRVGKAAAVVAGVGVLVPFVLGAGYWYFANPDLGAHPEGVNLTKIALFVGATLTATSVGITARVLSDLDQMRTREARTIIGAAVIDDVLGLVMLALVVGLAAGTDVTIGTVTWTLVKAVGFLVLAVIIGNFIGPHLFDFVDRLRVRGVLLVSAFCFALLLAALADISDSAMIIGSFAAGIILSTTNQFDLVDERIEPVADVFTPIFFVSVGAAVNVQLMLPWTDEFNTGVLVIGGVLTAVAIVGKIVSGFSVPWEKMNSLAIGVGMIPRGEVGLIFADIGRRGGLLSDAVFSAILIMVMVSTFITPPLLTWIFRRDARSMWPPGAVSGPAGISGGGSA